ncbi:hypothetical protein GUJ93_ZPchr0006g43722 [Zizania palustris]|uniref:Uncharacterized protein n=1 Tax=Zizania palustris TaxID=103762 RepID=A0A8J5VQM5_ZIZPA|nr:hypothetical protein GUJ93_ZPchr0006g43722 [Zizania palustris]
MAMEFLSLCLSIPYSPPATFSFYVSILVITYRSSCSWLICELLSGYPLPLFPMASESLCCSEIDLTPGSQFSHCSKLATWAGLVRPGHIRRGRRRSDQLINQQGGLEWLIGCPNLIEITGLGRLQLWTVAGGAHISHEFLTTAPTRFPNHSNWFGYHGF